MKKTWPAGFQLLFLMLLAGPAALLFGTGSPAAGSPAAGSPASDEPPAYRLEAGSLARSRIVAIGRDMVVAGEALSHAVVMSGSIYVTGRVVGDVIIIDGDAYLAETARLEGDVFVLGGSIEATSGSSIDGRSVAYPDASAIWMGLMEGPSMGLPAYSPVVLGAKLALLAFWAFMVLLLMSLGRRELVSTSESIRVEPFRNFFVGLTGVAAMVLTALLFSALSGAFLGVPLLVLVAVVALVLRFWGMVAVFHALGDLVCRLLKKPRPLPVMAASYGLLVLGVLKLLPWIGVWTWTLATFIGVGAALTTKLGRREDWLEST